MSPIAERLMIAFQDKAEAVVPEKIATSFQVT
jgi:hypothetical protein